MATGKAILIAVVAAVLAVMQLAAAAVDHPVGGDGAWDASGANYNAWASKQKIVQGDSVSFKYSPSHDVVEVTKAGYDACSSGSSSNAVVKSYTGGATTVKLATPGKHYFICSVPGHCAAGMKLEVTAGSASTVPAPAPTASKKPRHKRSVAPTPAPAEAPTDESSSTEVSTPTAEPEPKSSSSDAGMLGAKAVVTGFTAGIIMAILLLAM